LFQDEKIEFATYNDQCVQTIQQEHDDDISNSPTIAIVQGYDRNFGMQRSIDITP
jgi:hypothetical protein